MELVINLKERYDPTKNRRQMEFHAARETFKLYGGGMGGGKTAALINEGIQLCLDFPGVFGLLMRKTWPSFRDTVLPQLERFLPAELVADWNKTEKLITLINRSRIRYGGVGDAPDDWFKFMSGEYGWIAWDHAEEFTETDFIMMTTRLRQRLPDGSVPRYTFLLSANPTQNWIKRRFIEQKLPDHIFIPALAEDNKANLPPGYIERMKSILPPELARALLEGDWDAINDDCTVFPYLKVREAMERKLQPGLPIGIGVDVARSGSCETVIAVYQGGRVDIVSAHRGADLMKTCGAIWQTIKEFLPKQWPELPPTIPISIDADGVGGGVVDRMRETSKDYNQATGRPRIIEVHGGHKAKESMRFKNRRAELHWALREALDEISLPDDKELLRQLVAIRFSLDSLGRVVVESKDEMAARGLPSPDRAEAVMYALAAATGGGGAGGVSRVII